jgi:hypothetical protein
VGGDNAINADEFEKASGIGVVVTEEDIHRVVDILFNENLEAIKAKGHGF